MVKHGTASVAESMDTDEQTSRQRVVHNLSRRARDLGYDLVATREAVTQAGLGEARDSRIVPGKAGETPQNQPNAPGNIFVNVVVEHSGRPTTGIGGDHSLRANRSKTSRWPPPLV